MYNPVKARLKASIMHALERKCDQIVEEYIWDAENPEHCRIVNGKVELLQNNMTERRTNAINKVSEVLEAFDTLKQKYAEIIDAPDKES